MGTVAQLAGALQNDTVSRILLLSEPLTCVLLVFRKGCLTYLVRNNAHTSRLPERTLPEPQQKYRGAVQVNYMLEC